MTNFHNARGPERDVRYDPIAQLPLAVDLQSMKAYCRHDDPDVRLHVLAPAAPGASTEELYIQRLAQTLRAALSLRSDVILDCASVQHPETLYRALLGAKVKGESSELLLAGITPRIASGLHRLGVLDESGLRLPGEAPGQPAVLPVFADVKTAVNSRLAFAVEIAGQQTSFRERLEGRLERMLKAEAETGYQPVCAPRAPHSGPTIDEVQFPAKEATILVLTRDRYTDSDCGAQFAEELQGLIAKIKGRIVVDLSRVKSLSGAALGALLAAKKEHDLTIVNEAALPQFVRKEFKRATTLAAAFDLTC